MGKSWLYLRRAKKAKRRGLYRASQALTTNFHPTLELNLPLSSVSCKSQERREKWRGKSASHVELAWNFEIEKPSKRETKMWDITKEPAEGKWKIGLCTKDFISILTTEYNDVLSAEKITQKILLTFGSGHEWGAWLAAADTESLRLL